MRHEYFTCDICGRKLKESPTLFIKAINNVPAHDLGEPIDMGYKLETCSVCFRKVDDTIIDLKCKGLK